MTIFVYADESGVFDQAHQSYFVFGGVIYLTKDARDIERRKYASVENGIRLREPSLANLELKASVLSPSLKGSLYRSLNQGFRFAVNVRLHSLNARIFDDKKSKQRYLDYAFKIGLKREFQKLIKDGILDPSIATKLIVVMDEHSTATNGRYEMKEGLEQEFKIGTFNYEWQRFYPPILPNLTGVEFLMKDSSKETLIRAADIVANRAYYHALRGTLPTLQPGLLCTTLPS